MRELLSGLLSAMDQGRPCVYCSVVETRGSTPQKAGAAMLVFADGSQAGTLGGGCVEAEVKRQALATLGNGVEGAASGLARVLSFCLDDNYGWDDGLICGGRMSILAAPVAAAPSSPAAAYYRRLSAMADAGEGCTEAVVTQDREDRPGVGSRFLFDANGVLVASLCSAGPSAAPAEVALNLRPLSKRPQAYHQDGVAYLPLLPRITLLIVGGGHVGQAVARLAREVDFDVCVVDDRAAYASAERFPGARCVVGDIGQTLAEMARGEITPSTYAIIVTRGHAHDEEALFHLAATRASYVGLIGSRRKIRLIFEDLLARHIPREALRRVHAPLGLAIGSQTVMEIAVSIVAELIAVRNVGQTIAAARTWVEI